MSEQSDEATRARSGNPAGIGRAQRRSRVSLAAYIHDAMTEDEVYTWLREVAAGRDPDAPKNADGGTSFSSAPDWATRRAAMKMLLERRDGMPAQHVHLQQELRAAIGVASVSLTPQALAALPAGDKQQLRELLRKIATPVAAAAVESGRDAAVQAAIDQARAAGADEDDDTEEDE